MGMNETSSTSASGLSLLPDGIGTLTAIHFAIIAVLAIFVIIGLIWGIKAKRSRTKASHEVIAHAKEAGVAPEPVPADPVIDAHKVEQSQRQTQTVTPAPSPASSAQSPASPRDTSPIPSAPTPSGPTPSAPTPSPAAAPAVQPIADAPSDSTEAPERLADEPIAAASPFEASPATEVAAPAPVAPAVPAQSYADGPVTQLKGLGPKVAAQLGALGVSTVGEMAALSDSDAQRIDAQLGSFTGRMGRDRWIEQARLLAGGDKAGFEAVFGKL